MSDQQDKADKQFDPTPRRIEKAREEGNVFKSQDMTAITMLMTGSVVLIFGAALAVKALHCLFTYLFTSVSFNLRIDTATPILREVALRASLILLAYLGLLFVAGIAVNVAQSGWNVTLKPLQPKPDRISPLKGLKKIFSAHGMFNFLMSVLNIAIVGPIAYITIKYTIPSYMILHSSTC